jgi:hypothetical protein
MGIPLIAVSDAEGMGDAPRDWLYCDTKMNAESALAGGVPQRPMSYHEEGEILDQYGWAKSCWFVFPEDEGYRLQRAVPAYTLVYCYRRKYGGSLYWQERRLYNVKQRNVSYNPRLYQFRNEDPRQRTRRNQEHAEHSLSAQLMRLPECPAFVVSITRTAEQFETGDCGVDVWCLGDEPPQILPQRKQLRTGAN